MAVNGLQQSLRRTTRLWNSLRCLTTLRHLKHEGCIIERTTKLKPKPDNVSSVAFGTVFTDHMLEVEWDAAEGWKTPKISEFHNLSLSPGSVVLHYALEVFEGTKAYRGDDGKVRLFRPIENMKRMNNSAKRLSLPTFDGEEFVKCIKDLVRVDADWVPSEPNTSLYIRPTMIGTRPSLGVGPSNTALLYVVLCPVGPYFKSGFKPVSLLADPRFVRSFKGGIGDTKAGGNYGGTIFVQLEAEKQGCQQVLWLYGQDELLTEVGTMNVFLHWTNEAGENELVTPPLDGLILPGVVRKSLIELAQQWGTIKVSERRITMAETVKAVKDGRLKEMFGAGTACVVCPVDRILYHGENLPISCPTDGLAKRFLNELTSIQYGRTPHEWSVSID
ncbi:branched-chain-amino-acid aminotransferase, cytosolic-like [Corticium candelabrum]|uniref:branched-chain-amino-acid aminotransferase, cytosolic-like n=1 Tax=Corticium candelabrum TaxID=121492 RepID=UPI002E260C9F|nr:branched-chain-amino-acid aminotransferase, cytosolic-like [Corticium candelabrum]